MMPWLMPRADASGTLRGSVGTTNKLLKRNKAFVRINEWSAGLNP